MPSQKPVPGIREFLDAASKSLRGFRDPAISARTGGGYDLTQGPAALLWSREATRDRDLFRQCYTETATGADKDRLVEAYYKVERTIASYGAGEAVFTRPTASTSGTIWEGTRIAYLVAQPPAEYVVAEDTPVPVGQLSVPVLIRAARSGKGTAVNADGGDVRIDDPLFDAFTCDAIVCDEGDDEESDDDYLARARKDRRDTRVGHLKSIVKACKDAGAYHVVALHSGTFGVENDFGLNYVYVADANYVTLPQLKTDCLVALESVRVCGNDLQVLGMSQVALTATATVTLWDDPGKFNVNDIKLDVVSAIVNEFSSSTAWLFRTDALEGAALRSSDAVQAVAITTTPGEPAAAFSLVLNRYTLASTDIAMTITGPA